MQVVHFIGLMQVRYQVASRLLKSDLIHLILADLLQVVEATYITLVSKRSWQSICIKSVDKLPKTCHHQVETSDDDCKATSLK